MPHSEKSEQIINDHLFLEAVRCPLKLTFLLSGEYYDTKRPVYRQRNKLNVRDAVATRFSNVRRTSDQTGIAINETEEWLKETDVAICGAVVQSGSFITRIPVLLKKENNLTIVQIHGKLRKRNSSENINKAGFNRTENNYLLKAAYRREVLKKCFPDSELSADFYFPRKDFRSEKNLLHRHHISQEDSENLRDLFACVTAGLGVEDIAKSLPADLVHADFAGKNISEVLRLIKDLSTGKFYSVNKRSKECGYCTYRRTQDRDKSCWHLHFENGTLQNPDNHAFELMGYGNSQLFEKQIWYSENVEISDGLNSFDVIKAHGTAKITIQQRRNLQILKSKDEEVPQIWVKPGMHVIKNLKYPLHFIDFEASTYAIPMRRGDGPYSSLYFQFSCISLFEDGTYRLSEWLDSDPDKGNPHIDFVHELGKIPEISGGTIVQYSPFEKQAINNLINDFQRNSMLYSNEIDILKSIRKSHHTSDRFFDISEWIRNYYYNCHLKDSLGLKQVFESIADMEEKSELKSVFEIGDISALSKIDLLKELFHNATYDSIQENGSGITDGSAAMNAWISLKCGLLTDKEQETVKNVLIRYCSLDAYAMLYIYVHFIRILSGHESEIIVLSKK